MCKLKSNDTPLFSEQQRNCPDIAKQLVTGDTGSKIKVLFAGGRKHFLPTSEGGTRYKRK